MDPHKHWHLCGEHRHPSLLGQGARTGCFHGVGSQRGALALVGDVGSAPAPVNALLRNSCPCSQPSFPCRAAFPVLHSHCPQLLPGCLHSQGHRGHPEGLGLPGRQREAPGTFWNGRNTFPWAPPSHPTNTGRRNRNTGGAAGAVQTLRCFPRGERQEGGGGSWLGFSHRTNPSPHAGSKGQTGPKLLS